PRPSPTAASGDTGRLRRWAVDAPPSSPGRRRLARAGARPLAPSSDSGRPIVHFRGGEWRQGPSGRVAGTAGELQRPASTTPRLPGGTNRCLAASAWGRTRTARGTPAARAPPAGRSSPPEVLSSRARPAHGRAVVPAGPGRSARPAPPAPPAAPPWAARI